MGLKITIDRIPRQKIPGSSIIYIPSGQFLKRATFGFSSLAADLVYLWAIQYYSDYDIPDRFEYLDHIFSIIAELDPKYLDPYEVGGLIAVYEAHDLDLAFRIIDKGIENNPEEWLFPFEAGHYAQRFLEDFETARKYYKMAMEIEGSPPVTQRLYANAAFETMDYETAWYAWLEIYKTATDDRTKKIASNHLYRVKTAIDTKNIQEALDEFRSHYGHFPEDLDQLVQTGYMDLIPKDLDERDYLYDSRTGEIKPRTSPWKR
jgi:tetratricopeptide (TPR) repeat protein